MRAPQRAQRPGGRLPGKKPAKGGRSGPPARSGARHRGAGGNRGPRKAAARERQGQAKRRPRAKRARPTAREHGGPRRPRAAGAARGKGANGPRSLQGRAGTNAPRKRSAERRGGARGKKPRARRERTPFCAERNGTGSAPLRGRAAPEPPARQLRGGLLHQRGRSSGAQRRV